MRVIGFCLVLALLVLGPAQAAGGQSFFYGDGTKSVCLLTGTLDSPQALRGLMAWSSQALDLDQLRLLGRPHRDGLEFALVAQTSAPAEVILEVPTPMNSQLIAFLRAAEHEEMVDTFVYTVPMAPAQVRFYQQALGNGGWWPSPPALLRWRTSCRCCPSFARPRDLYSHRRESTRSLRPGVVLPAYRRYFGFKWIQG